MCLGVLGMMRMLGMLWIFLGEGAASWRPTVIDDLASHEASQRNPFC